MFDWIAAFIGSVGYVGVALLMFAENVFPPIPSELIMPLAGFNAAKGSMNLVGAIAAGSLGSLAGAVLWYAIGRKIGADRLRRLAHSQGRWLTIAPDDIDRATGWFERHGGMAVFLGRLVPTVRTFISVPAAVAEMPFGRFLAYSAIGTVIWTSALTLAGYGLESQYQKVSGWLNPVSTAVVVLLACWYLWRVATYRRRVPRAE